MMLRIRARLAARGWNLPVFQRQNVARLTPAMARTPVIVWPAALARDSISVVVMVELWLQARERRLRRVRG